MSSPSIYLHLLVGVASLASCAETRKAGNCVSTSHGDAERIGMRLRNCHHFPFLNICHMGCTMTHHDSSFICVTQLQNKICFVVFVGSFRLMQGALSLQAGSHSLKYLIINLCTVHSYSTNNKNTTDRIL